MGLLLAVLAGFVAALPLPWLHRRGHAVTGWAVALVPLAVAAYLLSRAGPVAGGGSVTASVPWVPGLDVALAFHLDGLSLLFALLVCLVGALVFAYAGGYMREHPRAGRFFSFLLMFMAAMLGLVLADNLITLYVFFELTSLASFLLIGFESEDAEARRAARQALLITNAGGLALLAGGLLLGEVTGTYTLSALLEQGDVVRASPFYVPILLLVLGGAFTKSAQVPFHVWLPNAMAAPTPVSAYLHSAAMVKAGIYLLARFAPVLDGTAWWQVLVVGVGAVTMLTSAWTALRQRDIKRILAYSTVMALGLIAMLLGVGGEAAVTAALTYVVVHALYKAALFMTAGALDHATGVRDLTRLGGLRRTLPWTLAATVLACVSMAGLPPFVGFIGKELAYEATLHHAAWPLVLTTATVLANVTLVGIGGLLIVRPFFGARPEGLEAHAPGLSLWASPLLLGAGGLLFGLAPGLLGAPLLGPATTAVLGEPATVELALWHGLTPALGLSVLTVALGLGVYAAWDRLRESAPLRGLGALLDRGPDQAFERGLGALAVAAAWETTRLQHGRLRDYVAVVFVAAAALIGASLWPHAATPTWVTLGDVALHEWALAVTILVATGGALAFRSRLATVLSLSVVSYSIALIFLLYGAPDLALTQLLVETLLAMLVVLAFVDLPHLDWFVPKRGRARDAAIAVAVGATVSGLMLAALSLPFPDALTTFFTQHSYTEAHGRNIVNVILVDFRALDTLGEISVLSIAGLSVYALIHLDRRQRDADAVPQPDDATQPGTAP